MCVACNGIWAGTLNSLLGLGVSPLPSIFGIVGCRPHADLSTAWSTCSPHTGTVPADPRFLRQSWSTPRPMSESPVCLPRCAFLCACFQFPTFGAFPGYLFSWSCLGCAILQVTSGGSKVVSWRWGKLQEWNLEVLKCFPLIYLGELSREGE